MSSLKKLESRRGLKKMLSRTILHPRRRVLGIISSQLGQSNTSRKVHESRANPSGSNVSQSQLEKVYRWTFFKGRAGESAPLRLVMDNIEAILLDRKSVARSGTIKIPDVWLADTNIGIDNPSPFQMLRKALLFYLEYANKEHIKYQGSHKTTPPPFDLKGNQGTSDKSTLDLSLYDSDNVHASGALSIEWTMLKLLAFPGAPNTISEMDVERHIGSILTGIFNVRGCTRYSSTTLKYPTILGCFGSYPRPHTACQISAEQLPGIKFCRPLVLAGEAKKQQNYVPQEDAPSGSANPHGKPQVRLPRPASQLAWAFQPALELFIVELITKYKNPGGKTWKEEWDPLAYAPIPSHMVVFGIVYDKDGLVIYSYSPTYKVLDGKSTSERNCFEHCSLSSLGVTS
ncbi:hypothetical protein BKA93DRAFT_931532 [Sparassis latifolia]